MSPTRLKTWLYRGLALVFVPLVLVLILEFSLRILGFGFNPQPLRVISSKSQDRVVNNDPFTWRFFPPQISRDFDPFIFPRQKAPKTFRIFVLGESAAQGVPDGAYAFSRQLEVMLNHTRRDLKFEVINTALTAVNSHVLLPLSRSLGDHQADAVIIYMGNNEVVGPYGPGTVFKPFLPSLDLIRFNIALKATRLGQSLEKILSLFTQTSAKTDAWRGMEMFLDNLLGPQDPRLEPVYQHFQANLRDMIKVFSQKGTPVLLCTVAVNLKDCPPFASLNRGDLSPDLLAEWLAHYKKAILFEESGEIPSALTTYQKALALDNQHADLHYRIARCAENLQDMDLATHSYEKALELDALRFRTVDRLNGIIRETALEFNEREVLLLDINQLLRKESLQGLPGQNLFLDHVHMNFTGNYIIAARLHEALGAKLPQGTKSSPSASIPSEEDCARELAYTTWNKFLVADEMLSAYYLHPPFSHQTGNDEEVDRQERIIEAYSDQIKTEGLKASILVYQEAIRKRPDDWRLRWKFAELLELGLNDPKGALEQYEAMAKLVPHSYLPDSGIALMNLRLKEPGLTLEAGLRAVTKAPLKAEVYNTLALAHQKKGDLRLAEKRFHKAMDVQPRYEGAYTNLARMQFDTGLRDESIATLRRGLWAIPGSPSLRSELADRLVSNGQLDLALLELRNALRDQPLEKTLNRKLSELLWSELKRQGGN